jgi:hypothetical protein
VPFQFLPAELFAGAVIDELVPVGVLIVEDGVVVADATVAAPEGGISVKRVVAGATVP